LKGQEAARQCTDGCWQAASMMRIQTAKSTTKAACLSLSVAFAAVQTKVVLLYCNFLLKKAGLLRVFWIVSALQVLVRQRS
jgi:hypothetical protein